VIICSRQTLFFKTFDIRQHLFEITPIGVKWLKKKASLMVLSMWLLYGKKYFSHLSLVIYIFPTPLIKLKLRSQIGERLLIANPLHQWRTIYPNQQRVSVRHCCAFFTRLSASFVKLLSGGQNHFCSVKPGMSFLTFLHPIFLLQVRLLSTTPVKMLWYIYIYYTRRMDGKDDRTNRHLKRFLLLFLIFFFNNF
jgi:hypothetical protein